MFWTRIAAHAASGTTGSSLRSARRRHAEREPVGVQGEEARRAVFLSARRHAWLHHGHHRLLRPRGRVHQARLRGARRVARRLPDARRLPRPQWPDHRPAFRPGGRGVPQVRRDPGKGERRRAPRVPGALQLPDRQEGRHPPRRLRRQAARPRRGDGRPGEAASHVAKDTVVSVRVAMHDAHGVELSAPAETSYLHGGYGGLLAGLEQAIEGKAPGETVRVQLEPEDAFGEYDTDLLRLEPAERYGEGIAAGMEVEEEGSLYLVTDVADGKVVLDGNHPLAGMALRFILEVLAVRIAKPEEIGRGVSLPR